METRRYEGIRTKDGWAVVTRDGRPLDTYGHLWNHSEGLEWGYGGSGPAQLALALLADVLGDDAEAVRLHQDFKWAVVAKLPREGWTLDSDQVRVVAFRLAAEKE